MANDRPRYELSEEELTRITPYLEGELSADEQEDFALRYTSDPHWHHKIEEVRMLITGIREANLRSTISAWQDDRMATSTLPTHKAIPIYRRWWAVACIALLFLGGGMWLFLPTKSTNETLYLTFFEPDMGLPVTMSTSDTAQYSFYDGMISYKEGNYADALKKWDSIQHTDTVYYFKAITLMALGDMTKAEELLVPVSLDTASAFTEDVIWYLALNYLHQGKIDEVIYQLKRIPHHPKSKELLNKLL